MICPVVLTFFIVRKEENNMNKIRLKKKCNYLGCKSSTTEIDNVEVAPGVIAKEYICKEHKGQLVGSIALTGKRLNNLHKE